MRKSGMVLAVFAALGMFAVGCGKAEDKKPTEPGKDNPAGGPAAPDLSYTEWNAWNTFAVGASVTMDYGASRMKTAIKEKSDKVIKLETTTLIKDGDAWKAMGDPQVREVKKEQPAADPKAKCPLCEKEVSSHAKPTWSKGSEKVAGKDVAVVTMKSKNCKDGKDNPDMKYSPDVPGGAFAQLDKVCEFEAKK